MCFLFGEHSEFEDLCMHPYWPGHEAAHFAHLSHLLRAAAHLVCVAARTVYSVWPCMQLQLLGWHWNCAGWIGPEKAISCPGLTVTVRDIISFSFCSFVSMSLCSSSLLGYPIILLSLPLPANKSYHCVPVSLSVAVFHFYYLSLEISSPCCLHQLL